METVPCNLCGSKDHAPVYRMPDRNHPERQLFQVVECRECGLGFVNPRPDVDEMGAFYPQAFYDAFDKQRDRNERRYVTQATYLEELEKERDEPFVIDVGCAGGGFGRTMQSRGWRVEGVDLFAPDESVGFPVHRRWFPDIPVDEPRYDAVTSWAVMEHVHNPRAYFEKASRVVKPGGLFVFLVTNFRSLASRCLFREDVPRHLYFFTEDTVRRYLEEAGFSLERADYTNEMFTMAAHNWLYYYRSRLLGRPFTWPPHDTYHEHVTKRGLRRGWRTALPFFARSPLALLDRLPLTLIERFQMWRGTYGIVVFTGRRRS